MTVEAESCIKADALATAFSGVESGRVKALLDRLPGVRLYALRPDLSFEDTHGVPNWDELPPAARAYLRALEELAGCPISIVSTGPDRDHTMVLRDPFA